MRVIGNLIARLTKWKLKLTDDAVFVLVVILCTFLVMILVNFPNHKDNMRLLEKRRDLAMRVKELQRQNNLLEKEIAALKTDRYYIEAVARRKFLLVSPKETVILSTQEVKDESDSLPGPDSQANP
jgi:cell division protein FtsB